MNYSADNDETAKWVLKQIQRFKCKKWNYKYTRRNYERLKKLFLEINSFSRDNIKHLGYKTKDVQLYIKVKEIWEDKMGGKKYNWQRMCIWIIHSFPKNKF